MRRVGGGGGNEDFHPTWQEEYDQLRFCEGVNDIFDTGPDNPSQLHPNYDFCAIWMAYLEDCILPNQPEFNDFEAIGTYEELVLTWAEFQYNNPELFTTIIADPADCTPTSELDDYTPEEEGEGEGVIVDAVCRDALDDFLVAHGITMTKDERFAILTSGGNPDCRDQEAFEEWVLSRLFLSSFSKKEGDGEQLNLAQLFSECFGTPDANGNYIDCNNIPSGSLFSLTLYADQPAAGDRSPFTGNPLTGINVGHTFLSLSSTIGNNVHSVTFGFYPSEAVDLDNPSVAPAVYDDGGHAYTSSVTIEITCEELNQALSNSIGMSNTNYDLSTYNCTDFGINVANSVGLGVEDTASDWVYLSQTFGNSSNPGDLGEDIKLLTDGTINSSGGIAPTTNCE